MHEQVWGSDTSLGAEEHVGARCLWAARRSRGGHAEAEKACAGRCERGTR